MVIIACVYVCVFAYIVGTKCIHKGSKNLRSNDENGLFAEMFVWG